MAADEKEEKIGIELFIAYSACWFPSLQACEGIVAKNIVFLAK